MAKDYASSNNQRKAPSAGAASSGKFSTFVLGMMMGILLTLVISGNKVTLETYLAQALTKATQTAKKAVLPKEKSQKAHAPQFDFYTMLPNMQVQVAGEQPKADPGVAPAQSTRAAADPVSTQFAPAVRYIIQIASFRQFADADKLKAKLALLGYSAKIQRVKAGNNIYNRVVMGPVADITQAQSVQQKLLQLKLKSLLIKE